jgi:hypothetical protein
MQIVHQVGDLGLRQILAAVVIEVGRQRHEGGIGAFGVGGAVVGVAGASFFYTTPASTSAWKSSRYRMGSPSRVRCGTRASPTVISLPSGSGEA